MEILLENWGVLVSAFVSGGSGAGVGVLGGKQLMNYVIKNHNKRLDSHSDEIDKLKIEVADNKREIELNGERDKGIDKALDEILKNQKNMMHQFTEHRVKYESVMEAVKKDKGL